MQERDYERIENLNVDSSGTIIDLSKSGVALLLSKPIENGSKVTIEINEIKIQADVIYSIPKNEKFRIGIHFGDISQDTLLKLGDYIDTFSKGVPLSCRVEDAQKQA